MQATNPEGKRFLVITADTRAIEQRLGPPGQAPRQDFHELARALKAEIVSYADLATDADLLTRWVGRVCGKGTALALHCFRKNGSFYFTSAENAGYPLAFLLKFRPSAKHVMIGHRISTGKKYLLARLLRLFSHIDATICYSRSQVLFARDRLRVSADKLYRIDFQVDEQFFTPGSAVDHAGIVSVGRELRDYATLFAAVEGMDVNVTVVASSPWSKRRDQTRNRTVPANVQLRSGLSYTELRDLYRRAALVVVPLLDVDSPAGVTSILEAQAVGRPVVVSASPGILDSIEPGKTAITVPCGDTESLRSVLYELLNNRQTAEALATAGRHSALNGKTIGHFISNIEGICASLSDSGNQNVKP